MMKTYTRDEIKRIMIDRPGEVFADNRRFSDRFKYDEYGKLFCFDVVVEEWFVASFGLPTGTFYHIESERESEEKAKKCELPESVRKAIGEGDFFKSECESLVAIFTAYHAEVIKLLEERK